MMYYTMKKINTVPNLFQIDVEDFEGVNNGYIYVSMEVYNSAVTLHDRFEGDIEAVANRLIKNVNIPSDVQAVIDIIPEPLDILVPYVLLCKNGFKDATLENVCGALTIMSRSISFKQFIVVPETVRSGVTFTRNMLSQYKDVWDMMFKNVTIVDLDTYTKDFVVSLATEILSRIPGQQVHVVQQQIPTVQQPVMSYQPQPQQQSTIPVVEQVTNTSMYDNVEPDVPEDNDDTQDDGIDFASMFDDMFDEEEKKVEEERAVANSNSTVAGEALVKEAASKLGNSSEDRDMFDVIKFYTRGGGTK